MKKIAIIIGILLLVGLASATTYTSQYPPTQNTTYVKATTSYPDGNYQPYFATNPALSVTGNLPNNGWMSDDGATTNQRFHIDLGSAKIIRMVYYQNGHVSGGNTNRGLNAITIWGSNTESDFLNLTYATDNPAGWTQLTTNQSNWIQHVASDTSSPQYASVTNTVAYRYYGFKVASNFGGERMVVRRIELQTEDGYSPPAKPVPSFTSSATSGFSPLSVQFNDTSITTPTAWNWAYTNVTPGNNTQIWWSTTRNATQTFGVGNWNIYLNVTNASGYDTTPNPYWINVTAPTITANFTCSPLSLTTSDTLSCVDSSVAGYTITNYSWTFEDSPPQYATTQNAAITYTSDGVWDVTLGVYNATTGWNNLTRPNYVTVSASGGFSGFNRQDIMMDQIYTLTLNIKDASTLSGIPGATIITSNGDNTTSNLLGVATITTNYTALVVSVGATGYGSRSVSYVIDRDRTETIYLTAIATTVNTTSNTNIVYVPKQIEITVMYYDPAGNIVPNAHVDLTAVANTLQADAQLTTLYGINPTAANQLMNGTLIMHGNTDAGGGIVFTILQSINYQAQVTDPKDSKIYTAMLFPGSDPYTIWIGTNPITNSTIPNAAYMNQTRLFVTQPDAGNITDNLVYRDMAGKTTSVTFIVKFASNGSTAYTSTQAVTGTNPVYINYTHSNIRGMGIIYGWNATKVL